MPAPTLPLFRPATPADAPAIAALLLELGYSIAPEHIPPRLDAIAAEHGATFLALDTHDHPIAFMSLATHTTVHADGPVAYITALVVSHRARGHGVGRRLVALAKEWATARGCARLTVTSAEPRADAHAFYPACGLPYTGRRFSTSLAPAR